MGGIDGTRSPDDFCKFPPRGPPKGPPRELLLIPPNGLALGGILGTSRGLEFLFFCTA